MLTTWLGLRGRRGTRAPQSASRTRFPRPSASYPLPQHQAGTALLIPGSLGEVPVPGCNSGSSVIPGVLDVWSQVEELGKEMEWIQKIFMEHILCSRHSVGHLWRLSVRPSFKCFLDTVIKITHVMSRCIDIACQFQHRDPMITHQGPSPPAAVHSGLWHLNSTLIMALHADL